MARHQDASPVDWLADLVGEPEERPRILAEMTVPERAAVIAQISGHVDVHLAQGHRRAAGELLRLAAEVAGTDQELGYQVARKKIRWLEAKGATELAITLMRNLFDQYRRSRRNPRRGAELAMELGILLDKTGQKQEALKLFRSAIERYGRLGDEYNRAAAQFNAASVLYDLGTQEVQGSPAWKRILSSSVAACERCLSEGGASYLNLQTHVTLQLANSFESQDSEERAREHYRAAADGYNKLGNRKQESDILYRLGWMAMRRGHPLESARDLQKALELKREHDYGTGLALYHLNRAEAYRSAGLGSKAVPHYRSSLALATQLSIDAVCSRARFGLYRISGHGSEMLPSFLKLKVDSAESAETLSRGRGGLYSEQAGDGFRTTAWRDSGGSESSPGDRTFLARLLEDLSRVWKNTGVLGYEQLRRQGRAVLAWQSRSRRGKKQS
ncbi:MAG: hypothetical protein HY319_25205 [Armatimonadetes bacterium]|nr:hypothetical protein [Armatimonadota bacterium]